MPTVGNVPSLCRKCRGTLSKSPSLPCGLCKCQYHIRCFGGTESAPDPKKESELRIALACLGLNLACHNCTRVSQVATVKPKTKAPGGTTGEEKKTPKLPGVPGKPSSPYTTTPPPIHPKPPAQVQQPKLSTATQANSVPHTNDTTSGHATQPDSIPLTNDTTSGHATQPDSIPLTNDTTSGHAIQPDSIPLTNDTTSAHGTQPDSTPLTNHNTSGHTTRNPPTPDSPTRNTSDPDCPTLKAAPLADTKRSANAPPAPERTYAAIAAMAARIDRLIMEVEELKTTRPRPPAARPSPTTTPTSPSCLFVKGLRETPGVDDADSVKGLFDALGIGSFNHTTYRRLGVEGGEARPLLLHLPSEEWARAALKSTANLAKHDIYRAVFISWPRSADERKEDYEKRCRARDLNKKEDGYYYYISKVTLYLTRGKRVPQPDGSTLFIRDRRWTDNNSPSSQDQKNVSH